MSKLENVVNRQKDGAKFVLSAQMLGMEVDEFEVVATIWCEQGGPGFSVVGVPHRAFVDGKFVISRVTVMKTPPSPS
ncbi:MAG TPA: hypothetical protein VNW52_06280 [Burkholderiaceae bacterium]|jgi:hypothetical protein|nr:hypothetical protein [Burkholderiaceae bacterium]